MNENISTIDKRTFSVYDIFVRTYYTGRQAPYRVMQKGWGVMDQMNQMLAKDLYESVKALLTEIKINFREDTEKLQVSFDYPGKDMPHRMYIQVMPDMAILRFVEYLPFDVPLDRTAEVSDAINRINSVLPVGNFYFDNEDTVFFNIAQLFFNSNISSEVVEILLQRTIHATEDFDDRLLAVTKGYMKPENVLDGLVE